jgi:hypothetical protein
MTRDIAPNHDSNYRPRGDTAMPTRTAMNHCEFRELFSFLRQMMSIFVASSGR